MNVKTLANVLIVTVDERIDHLSAPALEAELLPHVEGCQGEAKKLLIDCSRLSYISSAGLRVLMIAAKKCRKQDAKVVLTALQPSIQEIFRISRFDLVFEIFPSVRAALEALSPQAAALYSEA
jgi:anti-anti-sigma factor